MDETRITQMREALARGYCNKVNRKKILDPNIEGMLSELVNLQKEKNSIWELKKSLKEDEGCYLGWKANIAMSFIDLYRGRDSKKHIRGFANQAADNFLQRLIAD